MSLLMPEIPDKPDFLYNNSSTSRTVSPSPWNRYSTTPGSSAPGRVPMHSPSSAVKPIVQVDAPARSLIAHMLAPLPRCATMTRPLGYRPARSLGNTEAMYSYESPWKP